MVIAAPPDRSPACLVGPHLGERRGLGLRRAWSGRLPCHGGAGDVTLLCDPRGSLVTWKPTADAGEWRLCPTESSIMNIFDRKINFDALLKFSHITPSTQQHLKKVYASFALCMFVAAAGAYVHVVTHFIQAGLLSALGSLGLMIWLMATPHSHETEQKRLGLLAGFAFLTGVGLGPALDLCIAINPSILPTAFLGTAMIFTCFTLSALYARRRSYLFLGGILMSAMSLMLLSSLGNLFFGSFWLFQANLYVGLVVMCGFVLFDTQLIIEKAENGDKDYIWHCVDLFLDFVTLFRKLMMILAMNEKDKKKEKK
ncbi:bax inhibitor 1 isoform X1 [Phocoena phocoena]